MMSRLVLLKWSLSSCSQLMTARTSSDAPQPLTSMNRSRALITRSLARLVLVKERSARQRRSLSGNARLRPRETRLFRTRVPTRWTMDSVTTMVPQLLGWLVQKTLRRNPFFTRRDAQMPSMMQVKAQLASLKTSLSIELND